MLLKNSEQKQEWWKTRLGRKVLDQLLFSDYDLVPDKKLREQGLFWFLVWEFTVHPGGKDMAKLWQWLMGLRQKHEITCSQFIDQKTAWQEAGLGYNSLKPIQCSTSTKSSTS